MESARGSRQRYEVGFLAVLACIWMGGSLSLTTIVEEREVIDYERLLFLHFGPYLLAKTLVLWGLAIVQAAIFLAILQGLRLLQAQEHSALAGAFPWAATTLALVSCAAVGLGQILSATAKWAKSKELAQFLFPLVMMCQMVPCRTLKRRAISVCVSPLCARSRISRTCDSVSLDAPISSPLRMVSGRKRW